MNAPHPSFSVEECKIQASILLKALHSNDVVISQKAAKRFHVLPAFRDFSFEKIMQADIKRKHALAVIANEKGFASWADLKCQLPFIRGGFLNQWFANYSAAKSYQQSHGGFLLPFKKQFFVCEADYINHLGLNAEDRDWPRIHYDWVDPEDKVAWQRLYRKWMEIQERSHE